MNTFDLILLIGLLMSMVIGLWRGFVVEVLSLIVWVAAFWASIAFGDELAGVLSVEPVAARWAVAYAIVFVAVLLLGGIATWLIRKLIEVTGLSPADRLLGVGFGLARGMLLACVCIWLLGFTPAPREPWWAESRLVPPLTQSAIWLKTFLPPEAAALLQYPVPALPAPVPVEA